jgi:hypothetical protein
MHDPMSDPDYSCAHDPSSQDESHCCARIKRLLSEERHLTAELKQKNQELEAIIVRQRIQLEEENVCLREELVRLAARIMEEKAS